MLAAWSANIKAHVERHWSPAATHDAPCEVVVEQDGRGQVLSVEVRRCAAQPAWQDSLRNAVRKASPLPPPPDSTLAERRLVIVFHPNAEERR